MHSRIAIALATTAALASAVTAQTAPPKPVIATRSDLPPTRFPFATPPSVAMSSPEFVAQLPAIRREAERLLRDYDIRDATIAQDLRFGLATIAVLENRKADAQRLIADYRAAETKPQGKAIGMLTVDLAAATLDQPAGKRCDAAAARLAALLQGADARVIRDQFLQSFSAIQLASPAFYAGNAAGAFDATAKDRGSLDLSQVLYLAFFRMAAERLPACRTALEPVGRAWLAAPANQPVDIWPARQPAADAFANARPVVVAVWDRGFDTTMFPGQLAIDPAEPLDGRDNDGNGVVDDTGGPTYDVGLRPQTSVMQEPTRFLQARLASQMAYDEGELDLRFGLDTSEAAMFAQFTRTASAAEQGDEYLAQMENGGRSHGTACASEIADGAPYVRLYNVAALPWGRGEDKRAVPYDEATIARWAEAIGRIGPRMRGAGVRVVSMSWGLTADEITEQLMEFKLETDAARAKTRGIAMQRTIRDALERLVKASPNILFVVAAGNSNQADDVQSDAIQQLKLPNVVIVGATGTNGRPTAFTVFGPSVALYAQGEAVPLRWPGNIPVRTSGTSMAAPLVARAAAQMLAVNPKLSAVQVKAGLIETAGGEIKLLHPANAVAWASRR